MVFKPRKINKGIDVLALAEARTFGPFKVLLQISRPESPFCKSYKFEFFITESYQCTLVLLKSFLTIEIIAEINMNKEYLNSLQVSLQQNKKFYEQEYRGNTN